MPRCAYVRRASSIVLATVCASGLLLVAGCGGGETSATNPPATEEQLASSPTASTETTEPPATYPDHVLSGPNPSADELCGSRATWPDDVRFVTVETLMHGFATKTGYRLERDKGLDLPGARIFLLPSTPRMIAGHGRQPAADEVFGYFTLSVINPRCPALIAWLGAVGTAGLGGLVWSHEIVWEGTCWFGAKRYRRSNLFVSWFMSGRYECDQLVDGRWRRLDRVLSEIAKSG